MNIDSPLRQRRRHRIGTGIDLVRNCGSSLARVGLPRAPGHLLPQGDFGGFSRFGRRRLIDLALEPLLARCAAQ